MKRICSLVVASAIFFLTASAFAQNHIKGSISASFTITPDPGCLALGFPFCFAWSGSQTLTADFRLQIRNSLEELTRSAEPLLDCRAHAPLVLPALQVFHKVVLENPPILCRFRLVRRAYPFSLGHSRTTIQLRSATGRRLSELCLIHRSVFLALQQETEHLT